MRIDQKGQLSAKFENVSLGEIKSFFEQNYQIEFLGDEVLFQAHRSIVFNNLSLEAAIKRLFSKTNFVLNYDSEGTVIEVRLLPTGDGKNFSAVTDTVVENRQLPVQQPNVAVDSGDEITSFQIEEGSPPPGDFPGDEINPASLDSSFQVDAVSPALDPSFQVIPNSPPSGKDFQIVPGLPPSRK